MKTFEDLVITKDANSSFELFSAKEFFDNGYGISVIRGGTSYTNDDILDFEVAILKGNKENYELCYDTPITDDVIGECTPKTVSEIMKQIQELPKIN